MFSATPSRKKLKGGTSAKQSLTSFMSLLSLPSPYNVAATFSITFGASLDFTPSNLRSPPENSITGLFLHFPRQSHFFTRTFSSRPDLAISFSNALTTLPLLFSLHLEPQHTLMVGVFFLFFCHKLFPKQPRRNLPAGLPSTQIVLFVIPETAQSDYRRQSPS